MSARVTTSLIGISFERCVQPHPLDQIVWKIRGWKLHRCTEQSLQELARKINPKRTWLMKVPDRQTSLLALWYHQRRRFFTTGAV